MLRQETVGAWGRDDGTSGAPTTPTVRDVAATTLAYLFAPFLIFGVAVLCTVLAPCMLWNMWRRKEVQWWHEGVKR